MIQLSPSACDPVELLYYLGTRPTGQVLWIDKLAMETSKLICGKYETDPEDVGYDLTVAREL
jgi:hypothetical protein